MNSLSLKCKRKREKKKKKAVFINWAMRIKSRELN